MSAPKSQSSIIIGAQLQKARVLLGLSATEAATEIQVPTPQIEDWEKGVSQPRLQELEALASLYGREIDYFLRETPNPPSKIEFRGKPGESLRNLSKDTRIILARFDELCRAAVEFEQLLQKEHGVRLSKMSGNVPPAMGAQRIRQQFSLEDRPIPDLRNLLESSGARIFEMPIPSDEVSGFSFWHEDYGPCILLNAKDIKGRRNFTLAHELAHLLYSHGSSACFIPSRISDVHGEAERKANQFAVELLLPKKGIYQDFQKRNLSRAPSQKQLAHMSVKWAVSIQALGYRLEHLGLVNQGLTKKIIESRPYFRRPKVPTWERRLGKRFVETSLDAYRRNLISVGKLAHVLQIPIRKAIEIVALGGN